ncbi:putative serine/threonine-protein kinase SBK3 [Macrotis lagotis]|uniref:putative serine/threonine-protein kinase SBK3 n=1 Tax=Macrotis lagotis TaxID=92651 RepID=UPI003D69E5E2
METREQEPLKDGDLEEDPALALQRLVDLTASMVTPIRTLRSRYRLVQELGAGTYGRVLLARPRRGGPPVALKLLPRASASWTTFLREFCVGRCVSSHPGLLRTLAPPLQSPCHYAFAQEYAPCGDLSGMLEDRGLPELQLKRVGVQLARALDFLHSRGLVHADVKPDNVLVFDKACHRVALGDFGLTRPEGCPAPAPPGPLPSAPPELCLLQPPDTLVLRPELDSWGLGVLLFCAATAGFPWSVALAPDPGFETFAVWMTARPQPALPPHPWDQFSVAAQTLLRGLLALEPETRSQPTAVLDWAGEAWMVGGAEASEEVEEEEEEEEEEGTGGGGKEDSTGGEEEASLDEGSEEEEGAPLGTGP